MFWIKYICNLSKNEGWDSFISLLYFSDSVKSLTGKPWHSDGGIKTDTLLYWILCAGTFSLHILNVFIFVKL